MPYVDWEDIAWDKEFKGDDREMLDYYYNVEELTMLQIGQKIGINVITISKRLKELNIEVVRNRRRI